MADGAQLLLPRASVAPWHALLRRLALSCGIVLLIAFLAWIERDGYLDADGNPLTFLDAVYYATVTATTTGYGDIAPVSPLARATTAFVVTPLRILFLIVLVGTTIELLTERFRQARAQAQWRRQVKAHTVVVGYGVMGATAVQTLRAEGNTADEDIVVIDSNHEAAGRARAAGLVTIVGDATRTETLRQARIERAGAVVVTCNRDDTATLVTLTARELNPTARIAAAVREAENAHLLVQSGASDVVLSSEAAGRMIGLSAQTPAAVCVLQDLLVAGAGLDMAERVVAADEAGRALSEIDCRGLPIAVVRNGRRIAFDADEARALRPGDVVVSVLGQRSS
jgi:voltage-gated potassium channel